MPALPNVPSVVRVQFRHTFDADQDVLCRLYLQYSGTAPTNAQMNTFAAAVRTAWGTNMKSLVSTFINLTEVVCTDLSSSSAGIGSDSTIVTGTRTGNPLSMGSCSMVNLTIARRYRGGKPRIYFPYGISSDMTSSGLWSSAFQTAFNTGYSALIAAAVAAAWSGASIVGQVNVSYYSGFASVQNPVTLRWRNIPTPRVSPVVDAVTATALHPNITSQRRRNRA